MGTLRPVWIAAALLGGFLAGPAAAETLKREPAMGDLKPGQRVLVDDGSCPKGQIQEVIGGDHKKAGGRGQMERKRKCIPRP